MTRVLRLGLIWLLVCWLGPAQEPKSKAPVQDKNTKEQTHPSAQDENTQEPPEEDEALAPQEYAFNPLQAEKELKVGNFYFRKKNYRAAARRFEEATRWNQNFPEAYLRLGEAREKLNDKKAARDAFSKFVELAPDDKRAAQIKRKLRSRS